MGMKIMVFSRELKFMDDIGWFRGCKNISYYQNHILKEKGSTKTYYTLEFSYKFPYSKDVVSFAWS